MATMRLPSGTYHQTYQQDQAWWQTRFVWLRMIGLLFILLVFIPLWMPVLFPDIGLYVVSVANLIGYTILSAMGVQLLIGYAGQLTLGHSAFIAVGGYTSAICMLMFGIPYPITIILAALTAGLWSMLFGLPSVRVKGYYLIMTTMAAQFITVDFIITQYVAQIGGRGQAFSIPPGTITFGPIEIDNDIKVYYLMIALVIACMVFVGNLLRTRVGRAWLAIRDNDIAAEVLGVNVVRYKLAAYFVGGALGGIAGSFWITSIYAVSPEHFTWSWSLWVVGVILIGGVGSLYGTVFGAMFMTLVPEILRFAVAPLQPVFPQLMTNFQFLKESVFGLSIVLFLLYEPKGLAYRWWQIKNYLHLWPFSY